MDETPRGRGIIAGVMIFAALLILVYWVICFLVDRNLLVSQPVGESSGNGGCGSLLPANVQTPVCPVWLHILFPIGINPHPKVRQQ
jgi:hypothetical protein